MMMRAVKNQHSRRRHDTASRRALHDDEASVRLLAVEVAAGSQGARGRIDCSSSAFAKRRRLRSPGGACSLHSARWSTNRMTAVPRTGIDGRMTIRRFARAICRRWPKAASFRIGRASDGRSQNDDAPRIAPREGRTGFRRARRSARGPQSESKPSVRERFQELASSGRAKRARTSRPLPGRRGRRDEAPRIAGSRGVWRCGDGRTHARPMEHRRRGTAIRDPSAQPHRHGASAAGASSRPVARRPKKPTTSSFGSKPSRHLTRSSGYRASRRFARFKESSDRSATSIRSCARFSSASPECD